MPMKPKRSNYTYGANIGSEYTDDEREFMMAMERFKRQRGTISPAYADVLAVARSLGYRKAAADGPHGVHPTFVAGQRQQDRMD